MVDILPSRQVGEAELLSYKRIEDASAANDGSVLVTHMTPGQGAPCVARGPMQ